MVCRNSMAEASENHTEAGQPIIALGDEDDRKLFVGGLPQDATQDDISQHFKTFGEIENINLKTDQSSGRSRGFAFVLYKTVESLSSAIEAKEHTVKGKVVAVKKAQAKQGKIYVGKLQPEISDEEIKKHFTQFGSIAGVEQPFDKTKNERKNFCFITFDKEESAKQLLKLGTTTINGIDLDIKRVTVKDPVMGGMGRGGAGRPGAVVPGFGYNYYGAGYGYSDPYNGYGPAWGAYGNYGTGGWSGYGTGYMKNGYGGPGRGGPGGMRGRGGANKGKQKQ
uniref:RNA-binding protein squid n=1 Tax=Pseudodiaptomus poplesia TaxID=213370 RepID=A0A0U2LFU0_9MAXI|nr:RNA-binding protein squid [Pseudodiaptomus poplesia]